MRTALMMSLFFASLLACCPPASAQGSQPAGNNAANPNADSSENPAKADASKASSEEGPVDGPLEMQASDVAKADSDFPTAEELKAARKDASALPNNADDGMRVVEQAKEQPRVSIEDQPFQPATPEESLDATTPITANTENAADDYTDGLMNVLLALIALAVVGAGAVWLMRRSPKMKRYFGGGPIKVLSRAYLGPKYAVVLVKVGERVLVVGQGPEGLNTLSEISSRDEVMHLMAEVEEVQPDSASQTFAKVLREVGRERDLPKGMQSAPQAPSASNQTPSATPGAAAARPAHRGGFEVVEDSDVRNADPDAPQARLAAIREHLEEQKARLEK